MFAKHHRYFLVEGSSHQAMDASVLSAAVLQLSGEYGLGRMSPHLRFADHTTQLGVIRVSRETAPLFAAATRLSILRVCGSMRTCRPCLVRAIRDRYNLRLKQARRAGQETNKLDSSLQHCLDRIHRLQN